MSNYKYSVLTFIFGNYECLRDILDVHEDVEYVCVTDNRNIKSSTWKIIYDDINTNYTPFRKVVEVRYNPFKYVHSNICLLIDGSIQIKKTPISWLEHFNIEKYNISTLIHQHQDTPLDELNAWKKIRHLNNNQFNNGLNIFRKYNPQTKGLYQIGLMLVNNNKQTIDFLNDCYQNIISYANANDAFRADQIIFSLLLNSNKYKHIDLLPISSSELYGQNFTIYSHNSTTPPAVEYDMSKESTEYRYAKNVKQICQHINAIKIPSVTFSLCNFNTTNLTNACIGSIIKHVKHIKYSITILDNSNIEKFSLSKNINANNIRIIDNTKENIINFNSLTSAYCGKTINKYANFKHTASIDFLLNICQTKFMILLDSDILFKKNIDFVFDDIDNVITCADIQNAYLTNSDTYGKIFLRKQRFMPFVQLFNIPLIKKYHLHYFDPTKIVGSKSEYSYTYDTGGSFSESIIINNLKYIKINHTDYIEHLMGASWAKVHSEQEFLTKYHDLYT